MESTACLVCGFYINVSTAENNLKVVRHDEVDDDDPLTALEQPPMHEVILTVDQD